MIKSSEIFSILKDEMNKIFLNKYRKKLTKKRKKV